LFCHHLQTWSQYAEAAIAIGKRRWYGKDQVPLYIPDFTRCVDHFCLHAGECCVLSDFSAAVQVIDCFSVPASREAGLAHVIVWLYRLR
jgi:hypothetical protein